MFIAWDRAPRAVAVGMLGAGSVGPATLVMYAYMNGIYMDDPYNLPMPQMMNSFKLVRREKMSAGRFHRRTNRLHSRGMLVRRSSAGR